MIEKYFSSGTKRKADENSLTSCPFYYYVLYLCYLCWNVM